MHRGRTLMQARCWTMTVLFTLQVTGSAFAHKVGVFALVNDGDIEGEVYSSGGDALKDCPVIFLGPDGEKLGETRTQADGTFRFTPTARVEHLVVVDTGDGHRAEFKIGADELAGTETAVAEEQTANGPVPDDIDQRIADAVAREILPLRRQIDQWE